MNCNNDFNNLEILNFALENGILNMPYVQEQIEMKKKEELLGKHPYAIWEGSDGYWRTYLPDEEKGRVQKKKTTRDAIEKVVIDYWRIQEENPTINEVFEEWNDRRLELKKISAATHLRYKQDYNRHYAEFGKRRIKNVSADEFADFLEETIPAHNLTARAFSNLKSITRGMLKRAKKRKLITFSVDEAMSDIDVSDNEFKKVIKEDYQEVFNEYETDTMINFLVESENPRDFAILVMFVTGVRIGELVALRHCDVLENGINIRRTETRFKNEEGKYVYEVKEYPKSDAGVRTVYIPEGYLWILKKMKKTNPFSDYVFMDGQRRYNAPNVRNRLERVEKKLYVYHKSPHKIRKTYGTILMDNNVDNRVVMDQMGHTDIRCSERHYHRNRRTEKRKVQILSNLPDFQNARALI